MKIVVTGGAGFIGSHIVEHFQQQAEVVVLDNLRTGSESNLAALQCRLIKESVTNREAVFAACSGADYIFHLASMVSVQESEQKARECNEINLDGLLNVLDAAKENKVKKLVFSSSSAVYGLNPENPKNERQSLEPISPYGITKLAGEYYLNMYHTQYGLPTVALRYFNVYGPRQSARSSYAAVIPIFIKRALNNEDLVIYGDGLQTRDFIYVKDVVRANVLAAETSAMSGVYNVGSGSCITINDLAGQIITATASRSKIIYSPVRDGDIFASCSEIAKIRASGFVPEISLADGISRTVSAIRSSL